MPQMPNTLQTHTNDEAKARQIAKWKSRRAFHSHAHRTWTALCVSANVIERICHLRKNDQIYGANGSTNIDDAVRVAIFSSFHPFFWSCHFTNTHVATAMAINAVLHKCIGSVRSFYCWKAGAKYIEPYKYVYGHIWNGRLLKSNRKS